MSTVQLSDPVMSVERDVYLYRSYLAQRKYRLVMDEIKPSFPDLLRPLKQLAEFLAAPPARRDEILLDLDTKMAGNVDVTNHVLLIVAATIYLHGDQVKTLHRQ